jgi:hypothetical protein
MADLFRFRSLATRERATVAIGVLIDGRDAVDYLAYDDQRGIALVRAAEDLVELTPELRIPLIGTLLRSALESLAKEESNGS